MGDSAQLRVAVGEEEFLRARAVAAAAASCRDADPDSDVRELSTSQVGVGDLYDLLSPSLFAQRRAVALLDVHEATKDLAAALLAYAADPVEDILLVLTHSGGARNRALLDGLRGAGATVVDCSRLTRVEDRIGFVRAEVDSHGGRIEPAAVAALLDAVGTDLRELAASCDQLVADSGGLIDVAAVQRYHRGRADVSGFAVADRAVAGDYPGALEVLRWAMSVGVPNVVIADALADGVRSVARVSSAARASNYDLARALGMPPWKVDKARRQSRGWSERGLHRALAVVAALNAEVKGTVADGDYALERAIRLLTEAQGERRGGGASGG